MLKKITTIVTALAAIFSAADAKTYKIDISPEAFKTFSASKYASAEKHDGVDAIKFKIDDFPKTDKYEVVKIPIDLSVGKGKNMTITMDVVSNDGLLRNPNKSMFNGGTKIFFTYIKDAQPVHFSTRPEVGKLNNKFGIMLDIIPEDVLKGELTIGFFNAKGTLNFKNIELEVGKSATYWKPNLDFDFKCEYSDRLKNCPLMRGAMFSTTYNEKNLEDFRKWNGNLIRVSIGGSPGDNRFTFGEKEENIINAPDYLQSYYEWIDKSIQTWKQYLDKCQKLGIKVVVGLHSTPGFRYQNKDMRMFFEDKYADAFIKSWKKIARALNGHPAIWCYDLCNEPIQSRPSKRDYLRLQYQAARAVRAIDADTPISVEAVNWDNPGAFVFLSPLPLKDIIYQVHMYHPGHLTHQGVFGGMPKKLVTYPNPASSTLNKKSLVDCLQPVRDFQLKWGARIYVGEFSCVRWSPGNDRYFKDCIDIFEEYGWDWTYHAFREWNGWSVEHGPDRNDNKPTAEPTPAKKVILEAFKKNKF